MRTFAQQEEGGACISVQTVHGVTAIVVHISESLTANQNVEMCLHT